jgi:adenylate cyclase
MSGDPDQEYFADGMVEEIITALSRMRWLFVIARNSSFTYKGRSVDVKQVGHELGVRYVLEGSVRKAKNRVRITGQLIDASSVTHLWADRFDGDLEDIFDLQDQVTSRVVGAIAPELEFAEIRRAMRKPTASLDAYDFFLRAMASHHQWDGSGNQEALPLFLRAIEIDPTFASAYGMAARCYVQRKAIGLLARDSDEIAEAERLARKAGELGKDDAVALWTAGFTLAYVVGDLDAGDAFIDEALELNPNLTLAWAASGWVKAWLGLPEAAIERAAHAMRLSPHDTLIFSMHAATALGHFLANRYTEALHWAEAAVRERPNFVNGLGLIAPAVR